MAIKKFNSVGGFTIGENGIVVVDDIGNVAAANLTVSGNTTITGNLTVSGNVSYVETQVVYVTDPIVEQGGGPGGADLLLNDGKDRGTLYHYYDTTKSAELGAFIGWDNSNAEFTLASNVGISDDVVSINELGNVRVGNLVTGSGAGGTISGANIVSANYLYGTLKTSAQPNITSVGTLTSLTTSGNVLAEGIRGNTGYFSGNLTVLGNLNAEVGGIVYANSSVIYGNVVTGEQALYVGVPGYTPLPQTIVQIGANIVGYAQVNFENVNPAGTADYILTADLGTDTSYYLDMGIAGSAYDNASPNNSLGTSLFPLDSYIYAQGLDGNVGGNLVLGTTVANTELKLIVGGVSNSNIVATFSSTNVNVAANVHITGTTTANFFVGDGSGLTNIPGSSINGGVALSNVDTSLLSTSKIVSKDASLPVTVNTVIDSFHLATYRSAKYIIRASNDLGFESLEALLIHDGSDSYITIYGAISTISEDIIVISTGISGGNVELYASGIAANTMINLVTTYITD
jgi:hypothetical protein